MNYLDLIKIQSVVKYIQESYVKTNTQNCLLLGDVAEVIKLLTGVDITVDDILLPTELEESCITQKK